MGELKTMPIQQPRRAGMGDKYRAGPKPRSEWNLVISAKVWLRNSERAKTKSVRSAAGSLRYTSGVQDLEDNNPFGIGYLAWLLRPAPKGMPLHRNRI